MGARLRAAAPNLVVLALVLVGFGSPALLASDDLVVHLFFDDAYYYLEIARNVADGRGFTFDGRHLTNGFHPLWQLLLVPVVGAVRDPIQTLRVVLVLEVLLLCYTAVAALRILRPRVGAVAAITGVGLLVAMPSARLCVRGGMESALAVALLTWAWGRYLIVSEDRGEEASASAWWVLGTALALSALARLELVVAMPVTLVLLRDRLGGGRWGTLGALCLPMALAGSAYLAWNRAAFGLWLPVSGAVKAHWQAMLPSATPTTDGLLALLEVPWAGADAACRAFGRSLPCDGPQAARFLAAAVTAVGGVLALRHRRALTTAVRTSGCVWILVVAAAVHVADALTIGVEWPWYLFAAVLANVAALAAVSSLLRARRGWALAMMVAVVGVGALRAPVTFRYRQGDAWSRHRVSAAQWIDRHVPNGQTVASWNAGTIGWFAERPVVGLDGLVNDRAFLERVVVGGDLHGYLRDEGIAWIVEEHCGAGRDLASEPPYQLTDPRLAARLELVRRFALDPEGSACPGLAIWRLRPETR